MRKIFIIASIIFTNILLSRPNFEKINIRSLTRNITKTEPNYIPNSNTNFNQDYVNSNIPNILNSRNDVDFLEVGMSSNGYSFYNNATTPLSANSGNLYFTYRVLLASPPYNPPFLGSSGTLAAGTINSDLDPNSLNIEISGIESEYSSARYPSAILTDNNKFLFWNEYSFSNNSINGGIPHFSISNDMQHDSLNYSSQDFRNFCNNCNNEENWDFWIGSVAKSNEGDIINIIYEDWTTPGGWIFKIDDLNDGVISEISEPLEVGDESWFNDPDGNGGYASNWFLDINNEGIGYISATAYLNESGGDNPHTMFFKSTNDHGTSWSNSGNGIPYYQIPSEVLQSVANEYFTFVEDSLNGTPAPDQLFMTYDFDLKVDSQGNPHFIVGIMPASTNGTTDPIDNWIFPTYPGSGYYHFTIDKEYLNSPGQTQTQYGWRYSKVFNTEYSWSFSNDGSSFWLDIAPSLSISKDNDQIMYVLTPMVNSASGIDNPPNLDVFITTTSNGGTNWTVPTNLTDGSVNNLNENTDEVHAFAASEADNDGVNFLFTIPEYELGSQTGTFGFADYPNRVYVGRFNRTTQDILGCTSLGACNFNPNATIDDGSCNFPITNYDCSGNCIVSIDCNGDCGGNAQIDCNGVCDGESIIDACGICDGTEIDETQCGCECDDDCQEFYNLGAQSGDINLDEETNIFDILELVQMILDQ